ncbi:MAG: DNA gyrase subunit A [Ruminococcaceae bacterium]|nr:DNA gyrase subunit A [Oscillospiraceae bacterium]
MDELNNNVENTGVTQGVNNLPDPYANQKIINVDINKEVRTSFLDYSMSVIVSRALPDVRDGLKPVHRRILYTMYENNLTPDKAYRKCADTVGSVLGRYHPHGDASVYDAMVRLAQNFSMRYMLVDGHGNFGSVDGDPPAAYRYTESRMSKMSLEMLTDIEKNTVDFVPNYDDRLKEPTVLPSRYPNLLVNGSQGIAVGMATNIPPHNLREVIDAICCVIDNPEAELEDIMEHIKGPDFPTAGIIMGRSGIRSAYATGRGKVIVRAKSEIVEGKNGRFKIIITEIPYMVNKARLIESIADLVKDKRVEGIADINDYSSEKTGMHIEIDIKRDANAQVVLNKLFTYTQLQSTFGVILLAIVNGEPKILTLKEILQNYIDFQCQIIERRTRFELKKAEERKHILDGLKKAIDIVDDIIATIRACKGGKAEAKTAIMEKFDFDEPQATAIVSFQLGQLAGLEILKITNELEDLDARIKEYNEILGSHDRVLSIIKDEITVIRDKFGDDRRTAIENVSGEVDIEDLIPEETCMYTYTTMGYIKRQPVDLFAAQHRGGRGVKGMTRREDDVAETMFISSSHDYVMFLTTKGRAFRLKGYEIPEGSKNSKGMNIVNLLPLENGEKISAMLSIPSDDEGKFLCMFTKKGLIKRTALSLYKNIRKNGLNAISLREDDELVFVKLTSGNDDLLLATKKGMCIHINETNARPLGRTATGVKAITLKEGDELAGVAVLHEGGKVLTVSETGYGRRSEISDYRLQSRGGKGLKNYHVEKYGDVTAVSIVDDDEDIILISQDGIIIRIPADAVRVCARPSKGVKVMKVTGEDKVVTLSTTEHDEEEVNGDVEDDGSAEEGAGDTSGDNEDVGTPDDEEIVEDNEAENEGE